MLSFFGKILKFKDPGMNTQYCYLVYSLQSFEMIFVSVASHYFRILLPFEFSALHREHDNIELYFHHHFFKPYPKLSKSIQLLI